MTYNEFKYTIFDLCEEFKDIEGTNKKITKAYLKKLSEEEGVSLNTVYQDFNNYTLNVYNLRLEE